jgi:hypothetical protein
MDTVQDIGEEKENQEREYEMRRSKDKVVTVLKLGATS